MYCVRREGKKFLQKKTNTDFHREGKEGDKKRQQKRDRIKIEKNLNALLMGIIERRSKNI